MAFEPCERETILQIDDESKEWNIYTRQQTMMTKLNKITEPYKVTKEEDRIIEAWYRLGAKQISFKKEYKKRELTEEQRKLIGERLKAAKTDSSV